MSTLEYSADHIAQLEQELAAARQELIQKENRIAVLQATHDEKMLALELERDQIIQSLMESEERYRTHISATTALIWHGDAQGLFKVPQDSWDAYTGQMWPTHRDLGWMQMLHLEGLDSFAQEWQTQIKVGKTFTIECKIWSKEHQEYRHCEMNAIPIHNNPEHSDLEHMGVDAQNMHAWIGSVVDIHERKLAQERILSTNALLTKTVSELERSNTELDRFVYIASHDLKEPLRGIQNLATMLTDLYQEQLDPDAQELLTMMYVSAQRMHQLLSDLHKYSRVGLSNDGLQYANVDFLIDEIIMGLRAAPGQREFTVPRPTPLPTLLCNPSHLQTIFQNLISNALKYSEVEPVTIEIGLLESEENQPAEYVFFVRDNGIGIDPQYHDLIFEMFKRLHAPNAYGGGTGAGLALVKKILDQYGGRIWIESAPGAGSTFYFTFVVEGDNPESDNPESDSPESISPENISNDLSDFGNR